MPLRELPLTDREVAYLLAGLRLLQEQHTMLPIDIANILHDGAPDGADLVEIDALCEAINFGRVRRIARE
jgi:hypothetical protein